MKKIISVLIVFVIIFSLTACGGQNSRKSESTTEATTTTTSTTETTTTTEAATTEDTESEEDSEMVDGMRKEFKDAMDSYEDFYDEYCDFMEKYKENPDDLSLLTEYTSMLEKMEDTNEAFEKWEGNDLNDKEMAYYLKVSARIEKKLLEVSES